MALTPAEYIKVKLILIYIHSKNSKVVPYNDIAIIMQVAVCTVKNYETEIRTVIIYNYRSLIRVEINYRSLICNLIIKMMIKY